MHIVLLSVIGIMFVLKLIVKVLNYKNKNKPIPENVKGLYDQDTYQKWLSYTMDNFKFSILTNTLETLILIGLLLFGLFGTLETFVSSLTSSNVLQILGFMFGFFLIQFVIGLPFSYYQTFVIETKYGFNKTTKGLFVKDIIKNVILTIIFGGGIVALLNLIYEAFKDNITLFIGITYAVIVVVMLSLFIFNGVFVRIFNKLTPIEEGSLKEKIDALSTQLGFKVKRIYKMDGSKRSTKLNAFFTGIGATKEVVLFDTLMDKLSEDQILSVLAHELGHATHKDTLKLLVEQVIVIFMYVSVLALILTQETLYVPFGLSSIHFGFSLILLTIVLEPIQMVIGMVTNKISRTFEYKADSFAAKHTSKEAMISALKVLVLENYANLTPHPLYEFLYYNHPNISKRIESILST